MAGKKNQTQNPQGVELNVPLANLKVGDFVSVKTYDRGVIVIYPKKGEIIVEDLGATSRWNFEGKYGQNVQKVEYAIPDVEYKFAVPLDRIDMRGSFSKKFYGYDVVELRGGVYKSFYMMGTREEALQKLHDLAHADHHTADFTQDVKSALPVIQEKLKADAMQKAQDIAAEMRQKIAERKAKRAARWNSIKNAPQSAVTWVEKSLSGTANGLFAKSQPKADAPEPAAKPAAPAAARPKE